MKIMIFSLMLALLMGFAQEPSPLVQVDLNEQFNIRNGQEVLVKGEKLRIKFRSVETDSRCPIGVFCGWAGNAAIVLQVARKNKRQVRAMLNTLLEPREIKYRRYTVTLIELSPYPKYGERIDPLEYEATLIVTTED